LSFCGRADLRALTHSVTAGQSAARMDWTNLPARRINWDAAG
jgi:hypothetical protein